MRTVRCRKRKTEISDAQGEEACSSFKSYLLDLYRDLNLGDIFFEIVLQRQLVDRLSHCMNFLILAVLEGDYGCSLYRMDVGSSGEQVRSDLGLTDGLCQLLI